MITMHICLLICLCVTIYFGSMGADENESVTYESFCDPLKNNGECSDNFKCRCSTIVPTGERICALQMNCSSALPCKSNNRCDQNDSICVVNSQCGGHHLCYPISFTSPDICPPLATNDDLGLGD